MKCRTCKHWKSNSFETGTCSGLSAEFKVIPLPPVLDKKGNWQKRGKLLRVRSGVSGVTKVTTPQDFYCKNWRLK
jgi:hypothetical protein